MSKLLFVIMFMVILITSIFAADAVAGQDPVIGIVDSFIDLFKNGKALGVMGCISLAITIIIKILKLDFIGNLFGKLNPYIQRLLIVILGQASGILVSIISGISWWQAIITGLISSAGAVAIYEAAKPFFKKK